ncbi:MAG TPA: hypothetical protein P5511_07685, partial [Candidatus Goldiibacteriota bacterium]|nr:hypothetical protein [Candidatus Goldiibacteriota bacterium]
FAADSQKKSLYDYIIPYKSAIYVQTTGLNGTNDGKYFSKAKIWYKQGLVRTEGLDDKGNVIVIVIYRGDYSYSVDKMTKMAIKTKNMNCDPEIIKLMVNDERNKAVKKGKIMYNGEKCDIYEYNYMDKEDKGKIKYKVTEYRNKEGFILKSISEPVGKKDEKPFITEISGLIKNPVINDSLFEVPKDQEFTDLSWMTSKGEEGGGPQSGNDKAEAAMVKENAGETADSNAVNAENDKEERRDDGDNKVMEKVLENAAGAVFKGIFGQ